MSEVTAIVEAFRKTILLKKHQEEQVKQIKALDAESLLQLIGIAQGGIWPGKWKEDLLLYLACLQPEALDPEIAKRCLQERLSSYGETLEWKIPPDRRRRYWETCIELVRPQADAASCTSEHEQNGIGRCHWCQLPLAIILDIALTDQRTHFLGLEGRRLRIPACVACSHFVPLYMRCDLEGNAQWCPENRPPVKLMNHFEPWRQPLLVLGANRSPYESLVRVWNGSQLGGCPNWEQGAKYPKCCQCQEPMMFLAQAAWGDLEELGEGTHYVFLCRRCLIAT